MRERERKREREREREREILDNFSSWLNIKKTFIISENEMVPLHKIKQNNDRQSQGGWQPD